MRKDFSRQYKTQDTKPKKESKLKYFIYLLLFIFLLWLFFWSPVFDIKKITTKDTSDTEITAQIERQTFNYLQKNKNIFLLKESELQDLLSKDTDIKTIDIIKKIPNKIEVHITILEPQAILRQKDSFFLLQEGKVTGIIDPTQVKWDLPTIIISEKLDQNQFVFDQDKINFIREFYQKKQKTNHLHLTEFETGEGQSDSLKIHTGQGWYLLLNFQNDIDKVLSNLNTLFATKLKEEAPTEYIDMRLEDKVFYK